MNALTLDLYPRIEFIATAPQLRDLQQSSLWAALSAHQRHLAEVEPDTDSDAVSTVLLDDLLKRLHRAVSAVGGTHVGT
jgi:hypothetical protein